MSQHTVLLSRPNYA